MRISDLSSDVCSSDLHAGIAPDAHSDVPAEAMVSPIFIRNPVYGTRCRTIVAVDAPGQGVIAERRFDADGAQSGASGLALPWPARGRSRDNTGHDHNTSDILTSHHTTPVTPPTPP